MVGASPNRRSLETQSEEATAATRLTWTLAGAIDRQSSVDVAFQSEITIKDHACASESRDGLY